MEERILVVVVAIVVVVICGTIMMGFVVCEAGLG